MTLGLLLLLACGDGGPGPLAPAPAVWVEARRVEAGQPVVLHAPADTVLPAVEGLTIERVAVGDDGQATFHVTGEGSHLLEVPSPEGPPATFYLDLGVQGPGGGPMEDVLGPPPPAPARWPWVVAAAALALVLGLLGRVAWVKLRARALPPPPPEPADRVARREWEALRRRTDLAPEPLALALSAVYRRYLEAAGGWPATQRTTREILDNLAGTHSAAELEAARRLLLAMDLVKFAGREVPPDFFPSLDADFDRLVRPTRGEGA